MISKMKDEKKNSTTNEEISKQITSILKLTNTMENEVLYKMLEDLLHALNVSINFTVINHDGKFVYVNNEFCKLAKYEKNEIIGKPFQILNSSFQTKEFYENMWKTIESGETWRGEIQQITKDGYVFWTSSIIVPFKDNQGQPKYFIGFHTDITEKKQLDLNFKANFIRTFQNLQNGIFKVRKEADGSLIYTMAEGKLLEEIFGNTDEYLLKTPFEIFDPDIAQMKQEMYLKAFEGKKVDYEFELFGRVLYVVVAPIRNNGVVTDIVGTVYDFSEFQDVRRKLKANEKRYQSLIQYSHEYITTINKEGIIVHMNPKTMELLGVNEDVFGKIDLIEATVEEDRPIIAEYFNKAIRGEIQFFEHEVKNNGQRRFLNVTLVPIIIDNEIEGVYSIGKDITEEKLIQERNAYLAHHDELTGLTNRRWMEQKIQDTLKFAEENNQKFAILSLDLDRFKAINDTLGHFVGDELLQQIAYRLQNNVYKNKYYVARMGGDEFMILCPSFEREEEVIEIAEHILESLAQPLYIQQSELFITASIGIVFYPSSGSNVTKLLKRVDIALYKAKELGRNMYQIYELSMNKEHYISFILERDLRKAILNDEFIPHLQPRVNAFTGKIIGAEALIRWKHPEKGLISPGQFIPIAEETGLIIPIGKWMMKKVCEQLVEWKRLGYSLVPISINISSKSLLQQGFADEIRKCLEEFKLEGKWLEIEITENSIMRNEENVQKTLKEIKEMGVKVFIDDFGTGYSSFNYLKTFEIDGVKVDQSFIRDISNKPENASITSAMIKMAQLLKLEVVAEGVETEEELDFLLRENCCYIQGYFFGKPCPIEEFEKNYLNFNN